MAWQQLLQPAAGMASLAGVMDLNVDPGSSGQFFLGFSANPTMLSAGRSGGIRHESAVLHFVRVAWGGEDVHEGVSGVSPSSACAAMQPDPSTATPAAVERPKRQPSPIGEVRADHGHRSRDNYQHLVFCNPAGPGNRLYAEASDRRQMGWPARRAGRSAPPAWRR